MEIFAPWWALNVTLDSVTVESVVKWSYPFRVRATVRAYSINIYSSRSFHSATWERRTAPQFLIQAYVCIFFSISNINLTTPMIFVKSTNVVFWYDYFTFKKRKKENQCKIAHLSQPFFSSLKHIKKSYIYTASLTDCSTPCSTASCGEGNRTALNKKRKEMQIGRNLLTCSYFNFFKSLPDFLRDLLNEFKAVNLLSPIIQSDIVWKHR